jgi:CxxC motif-containing protein
MHAPSHSHTNCAPSGVISRKIMPLRVSVGGETPLIFVPGTPPQGPFSSRVHPPGDPQRPSHTPHTHPATLTHPMPLRVSFLGRLCPFGCHMGVKRRPFSCSEHLQVQPPTGHSRPRYTPPGTHKTALRAPRTHPATHTQIMPLRVSFLGRLCPFGCHLGVKRHSFSSRVHPLRRHSRRGYTPQGTPHARPQTPHTHPASLTHPKPLRVSFLERLCPFGCHLGVKRRPFSCSGTPPGTPPGVILVPGTPPRDP